MQTYTELEINKSIIYKENKNKIGVYMWINLVNNKRYVGSSINLGQRLSIYFSKKAMLNKLTTRTSIIYSALLKHGYVNFKLEILEYCDIENLILREQHYIDILKPEYNILKAANSRIGYKHTRESRVLIGLKQRGENHHFYGKIHSYETRVRISESLKSLTRVKKSGNQAKFISSETRLKLSLNTHGIRVKVYGVSNNLVNEFLTITSTAKHFNVSNTTIRRYLDKNKSYDGFIFKSFKSK